MTGRQGTSGRGLQPDPIVPDAASAIRFEVRRGARLISCLVLDDALEAASVLKAPTSILRRKSFDRFRTLIDAAAQLKLSALPADFAGPLVLRREDLHAVPPEKGVPSFGSAARMPTRPPVTANETADASEVEEAVPPVG